MIVPLARRSSIILSDGTGDHAVYLRTVTEEDMLKAAQATATAVASLPPTPTPTSTPIPDTPPGTILEFGQTWRQAELELTLTNSGWGSSGDWMDQGGGMFTFILTNLAPYDRSFHLSSDNFSAVDNLGRVVPLIPVQNMRISEHCPPRTVKLRAGETKHLVYELRCPDLSPFALIPRIDAGDSSITEIVISASVSSISNARWRIRIYH
jgi:hypothetical protein